MAPAGAFPHTLLEEAEARWKASVRAPPHGCALLVRPRLSTNDISKFVRSHGRERPCDSVQRLAESLLGRPLQETASDLVRPAKTQDSVSKALWKMGISHTTQHLTADGLFCVDIALDDEQVPAPCSQMPLPVAVL